MAIDGGDRVAGRLIGNRRARDARARPARPIERRRSHFIARRGYAHARRRPSCGGPGPFRATRCRNRLISPLDDTAFWAAWRSPAERHSASPARGCSKPTRGCDMVPGACFKGALAGSLMLLVAGCMSPAGDTVAEMRAEARRMRTETPDQALSHPPRGQAADRQGPGRRVQQYRAQAVRGFRRQRLGHRADHKTGQDTYMKMVSAGLGLGLGVKDFRGVFVFTTRRALRGFVEDGWDASAEADAAFKSGEGRRLCRRDRRGARHQALPDHRARPVAAGNHPGHPLLGKRRNQLIAGRVGARHFGTVFKREPGQWRKQTTAQVIGPFSRVENGHVR